MVQHAVRPHVSAALVQLRRGVTVCALAVILSALTQMFIFALVHFTETRFQLRGTLAVADTSHVEDVATDALTAGRALSELDRVYHFANMAAVTLGSFGSILLAIMTSLGVILAASVPGVQRAVSAAMWAMLIAVAALPWSDFLASIPWPGVFGPYAAMTAMSAAVDARQATTRHMAGIYLAMPLMAMILAMVVFSKFRRGVADGVSIVEAGHIERQLEAEMASIRERGVAAGNVMRTVSALNQVVGETMGKGISPVTPPIQPEASQRMSEEDAIQHLRGIKKVERGEPMRRLI